MSKASYAIVDDILKALRMHGQVLLPGRIEAKCVEYGTARLALDAFIRFGGHGWLCTAESRAVEVFEFEDISRRKPTGSWPRWGELVNGEISLHLRHVGSCWALTELWQVEDQESILVETRLLRQERQEEKTPLLRPRATALRYHVAYTRQQVQGLWQYRPQAYRFLGFEPGDKS